MRRLIRNRLTGDYLGASDSWGQDYSVAIHFENTISVLRAARLLDRTNLEEVLMVRERPSAFDVVLPLCVPVWETPKR